jgi:hypothetical protein
MILCLTPEKQDSILKQSSVPGYPIAKVNMSTTYLALKGGVVDWSFP